MFTHIRSNAIQTGNGTNHGEWGSACLISFDSKQITMMHLTKGGFVFRDEAHPFQNKNKQKIGVHLVPN